MTITRPKLVTPVERRLALLTLISTLVPSVILLAVLWFADTSVYILAIVSVLLLFFAFYTVSTVWRLAEYQFKSIHNLLDAAVQGDYSFRGSSDNQAGPSGELMATINELADTLQRQRLLSEESQLLVQKVVDQIDVAIIAWDQANQIKLLNPAASHLLGIKLSFDDESEFLLPEVLLFANSLEIGETQVRNLSFDSQRGRFRLRLEQFISEGNIHKLLFLTNVSSILRLEERRAWRNLVRVLSHEINNSLTPLKSFSNSLRTQIQKREADPTLKQELLDGMTVIGNRANTLAHFVQSYHKITKLPDPTKSAVSFKELIEGLVKLFPNSQIGLQGEPVSVQLDSAQIEQVMINLLKNAAEASEASETDSKIEVLWRQEGQELVVEVLDSGEGIQNPENIFTPYYTTKPTGSGIGLVFCQQVIEAHGGYLSVSNRKTMSGCEARFTLPLT